MSVVAKRFAVTSQSQEPGDDTKRQAATPRQLDSVIEEHQQNQYLFLFASKGWINNCTALQMMLQVWMFLSKPPETNSMRKAPGLPIMGPLLRAQLSAAYSITQRILELACSPPVPCSLHRREQVYIVHM